MRDIEAGLIARDLCRDFRLRSGGTRRAVDDVNLTVRPGELVSVLGPNGAGKTTTVRMLTGLLLPTSGKVLVGGHDMVGDRTNASRACGFSLGGETGLYPRLSAAKNLTFFGLMYGLRGASLDRRAAQLLEMVDLADRARDLVGSYSRGMKQRLHLARALLHDPPVLILDEPSAGLDPQSAAAMRELVARLAGQGRSVLLTTHDMREAEQLSDRIVMMKDGRVHLESTAPELRLRAAERLGHVVTVVFAGGSAPDGIGEVPGAVEVRPGAGMTTLRVTDGAAAVQWVMARFGAEVTNVSLTPPTLEEVFLEMVAQS